MAYGVWRSFDAPGPRGHWRGRPRRSSPGVEEIAELATVPRNLFGAGGVSRAAPPVPRGLRTRAGPGRFPEGFPLRWAVSRCVPVGRAWPYPGGASPEMGGCEVRPLAVLALGLGLTRPPGRGVAGLASPRTFRAGLFCWSAVRPVAHARVLWPASARAGPRAAGVAAAGWIPGFTLGRILWPRSCLARGRVHATRDSGHGEELV